MFGTIDRMAGEIIKTQGIVLSIHPWSQTSHVVTWLTPDHGPVTTLVKGAVRAKSAFLGQYDLFYRCDLLYYARASGDLHALREVTPRSMRTHLRGDWRATALAGYAADLVRELAPPGDESSAWFDFLDAYLEPAPDVRVEEKKDAARFLGVFLSYHIERPPDIRRSLVSLIQE